MVYNNILITLLPRKCVWKYETGFEHCISLSWMQPTCLSDGKDCNWSAHLSQDMLPL